MNNNVGSRGFLLVDGGRPLSFCVPSCFRKVGCAVSRVAVFYSVDPECQ